MNPTIHLSFRYAERDYVRALRGHYAAHYASHFRLLLDIGAVMVLLCAGVYLLRQPSLNWLGIVCLVSAAGFVFGLIGQVTVLPVFAFRREPKFHDEFSLTFSPEGIHFRTVHVESQLQWNMYSRAVIDAHSYLLYYGPRQFTIIPKRAFQNAEQQETFERLLTERISKIIRRRSN